MQYLITAKFKKLKATEVMSRDDTLSYISNIYSRSGFNTNIANAQALHLLSKADENEAQCMHYPNSSNVIIIQLLEE